METVKLSDNERLITLTKQALEGLENENRELKQFQESKTIRIIYGIGLTVKWDRHEVQRDETIYTVPSEEVLVLVDQLLQKVKEENNEVLIQAQGLVEGLGVKLKAQEEREKQFIKRTEMFDEAYNRLPRIIKWFYKK